MPIHRAASLDQRQAIVLEWLALGAIVLGYADVPATLAVGHLVPGVAEAKLMEN